jgi:hypothetical protein
MESKMKKRILFFGMLAILGIRQEPINAAAASAVGQGGDNFYEYDPQKAGVEWNSSIYSTRDITPLQKFETLFSQYKLKSSDPKMKVVERVRPLVEAINLKTQEMAALGNHVTARERDYINVEIKAVNGLLDKISTLLSEGTTPRSMLSLSRKKTLSNQVAIEGLIAELMERKGRISSVINLAADTKTDIEKARKAAEEAAKRREWEEKRQLELAEQERMKVLLAEFMAQTTESLDKRNYSLLAAHEGMAKQLIAPSSKFSPDTKARVKSRLDLLKARATSASPVQEDVYGYDNDQLKSTPVMRLESVYVVREHSPLYHNTGTTDLYLNAWENHDSVY